MERRHKIILGIFAIAFAAVVYLEASQPEPVDWSPSYSRLDKIPLGAYVFYENLKKKFPEQIRENRQSPFEFLADLPAGEAGSTVLGTYFFLNQQIAFGEAELNRLLDWVGKGNTVFISAKYLGEGLLDTLNLKTDIAYLTQSPETQPLFNFTNPKLKSDSAYKYQRNIPLNYFSEIDTLNHTVLGVTDLCENCGLIEEPLVNFLEIPVGEGAFFLHLAPEVFGNYFMLLENNSEYAEKAMAYIDFKNPVYWDGRYKSGRPLIVSPLSILLGNRYLKWAYYFVLIGAVLFVFFEGKRKQKSIAIVPPLSNKTREFTDTVAGLYLEKNDHKAISEKKISLFLDYLRINFRVDTQKPDKTFLETLAARSGNTQDETRELFQYIAKIQKLEYVDKKELLELNKRIEKFKKT